MSVTAIRDSFDQKWHHAEEREVILRLGSHPEKGLTAEEVARRQAQYGFNELTGKKEKSWWLKFLLQYKQPLLIVLVGAGFVKFITGSFVNAGVIWGVTTTNAIISFVQESKAEGAIVNRFDPPN